MRVSEGFVKKGGLDVCEAWEGARDRSLKMMNRSGLLIHLINIH